MVEERLLQIQITLRDLISIRYLEIDNECMPIRKRSDGMIEMNAIATESTVAKLRKMRERDVRVEVLSDRTDRIASVKRLVSPTNRYAERTDLGTDQLLPGGDLPSPPVGHRRSRL